jgi:hemoglobin
MALVPAPPEPDRAPIAGATVNPTRADTWYAAVGGEATFRRLVDAFYAGVAEDPELRAIYPEQDLRPAADRLSLFLIQYWGGPSTYSERRGHPRLRLRHAAFVIDLTQRDRWLRHMRAALDSIALPAAYDQLIWDYFTVTADSMRNVDG